MHLLRHKKSGDVYAFHKVLMDSGDFEIFAEKIEVLPEPVVVKVTRRKKVMQIGELNGTNPK